MCGQGYFGPDCSEEAVHLQYGQMLARGERAFEYDYFQLPPVSPSMTTHR